MGSNPTATALTCDDTRFLDPSGGGSRRLWSQLWSQFRPERRSTVVHHRSPSSTDVQNQGENGEEHAFESVLLLVRGRARTSMEASRTRLPGALRGVAVRRDMGSAKVPVPGRRLTVSGVEGGFACRRTSSVVRWSPLRRWMR